MAYRLIGAAAWSAFGVAFYKWVLQPLASSLPPENLWLSVVVLVLSIVSIALVSFTIVWGGRSSVVEEKGGKR